MNSFHMKISTHNSVFSVEFLNDFNDLHASRCDFQLDISDFSDLFFIWDLLHASMNSHNETWSYKKWKY